MFFITTDIKGVKGKISVFYKISFSNEKFKKYLLELAYQKVTIHLEIKRQHFPLFGRNKRTKIIFSDSLLIKSQDCLEDYILLGRLSHLLRWKKHWSLQKMLEKQLYLI
ncbi:hypothetical protein [Niallia sp. MER TA 168]|uniref:hypothetical protein n=1 Tax=Niallia sp. MER TA 168 TaxID=2939568 RepID=UPI00203B6F5E|nr:hypothetical protein [Niallia sp. MER TA 168]MCM3362031.1 hypothetical protein [Niallia sp. MER TA 168]